MSKELVVVDEREVLGKEFKIYRDFDNPLFLAKDVAEWIEHKKPNEMIANVDDNEKVKIKINPSDNNARVLQNNTEYWFLTEDGLHEVLMQSRKPVAKQFKKQVKLILKTLRKDGMYVNGEEKIANGELDEAELVLKAMTLLQNKIERYKLENEKLEAEKEEMKPIVALVDNFISQNGTYDMNTIAKSFGIKNLGRNNMMEWMRDKKILMHTNEPYQSFSKYFKVILVNKNGYVTSKSLLRANGVKYLYDRLIKDGMVVKRDLKDILNDLSA